MKTNRIYWNLRTGLAGGFFLAADNCPYLIVLFETARGTRAYVADQYLNQISSEMKIESAKRKVKALMRADR